MTHGPGRLIVVSNRIPTEAEPSGGLVVALHAALSDRGGVWIGSSGERSEAPGDDLRPLPVGGAYERLAFDLTEAEHQGFYLGYANSVLWPLFHHRADLIHIEEADRHAYLSVNRRVADMIAKVVRPDDVIWVHDYHFLPLARELRRAGVTCRLGFFLHIPFPYAGDIQALPDAREFPGWLAAYDLVGLQTQRDVATAIEYFRKDTVAEFDLRGALSLGDRSFEIRSFPIGIDVDEFQRAAEAADIEIVNLPAEQKLLLGVDRLDYSKGLPQRFAAFAEWLDRREETHGPRATLLQIAPPSREDVEAYREIREELERLAGSVNGEYAELDWTPIRYLRRPLPREVIAGLYRRADVMLVTPLADGMNLVAKEYVAAQDGADPGVLILSPFAGAAEQLSGAVMVSPYDAQGMADAIEEAIAMPLSERQARYLAMMHTLRETDIAWWTDRYLRALHAKPAA
ncbi:MAG: alpha,alpha-trehalose-phosphate synthase (UDP-forming) [Paracoccaceae bacterium]